MCDINFLGVGGSMSFASSHVNRLPSFLCYFCGISEGIDGGFVIESLNYKKHEDCHYK